MTAAMVSAPVTPRQCSCYGEYSVEGNIMQPFGPLVILGGRWLGRTSSHLRLVQASITVSLP
jgi:hypothetical protein